MVCGSCGHLNAEGARFCSGCGASLAAAAGAVAVVPVYGVRQAMVRAAACSHCGAELPPIGYFARPANIILLVVAASMWFVPGLIYFLARKDSLVCGNCGRKREPW